MGEMTIATLGERIRKLRKERGLTLAELAGDKLSKGMLSLIENNRAKPSMESLEYIAKRLGVEPAELLEEVSTKELRDVLEKVEKLLSEDYKTVDQRIEVYKQALEWIQPYLENLKYGYEAARLLELYGRCLIFTWQKGWEPYLQRAAAMYDEMNLTARRAEIGILRFLDLFEERKYEECLSILEREWRHLVETHAYIDPLTRLKYDYYRAILQMAVGDIDAAIQSTEKALQFSREEKIFYLLDVLYRLGLGYATVYQDLEKVEYYSRKLKQYIALTEDEELAIYYDLMRADRLLTIDQNYEETIEICNRLLDDPRVPDYMLPFIYITKGTALYYRDELVAALHWLEKAELPKVIVHPIDLTGFYLKDVYRGLIYKKMGEGEKAKQVVVTAWKNISELPWTPYHDFAQKVYNEISQSESQNGDQES